MQDTHSITVAGDIRRKLSLKLISGVKALDIVLVGEKVETDKSTVIIKIRGHFEIRGEAPDIHIQGKVISAVKEMAGGRTVRSLMTVKKDDPLRRRGLF